MRMKQFFLTIMAILPLLTGCKSQKAAVPDTQPGAATTAEVRTMPEGKLLSVSYSYQGMAMNEFGDFELKRTLGEADGNKFSFRHFRSEMSFSVPDSLFDAARRIIEEEHIYAYDASYGLPPELERQLLDGYRWELSVRFEGTKLLLFSGKHVSPEGNGLNRLNQLLSEAARRCVEQSENHEDGHQ